MINLDILCSNNLFLCSKSCLVNNILKFGVLRLALAKRRDKVEFLTL
jgi:hypothetical protein